MGCNSRRAARFAFIICYQCQLLLHLDFRSWQCVLHTKSCDFCLWQCVLRTTSYDFRLWQCVLRTMSCGQVFQVVAIGQCC